MTSGRARRSWTYARISNQVQRSAAPGERSLGGVHLRTCFVEALGMFNREPSDVHPPDRLQIRRVLPPPPEPERLWGFRGFGETLHLQADERPADAGTGRP